MPLLMIVSISINFLFGILFIKFLASQKKVFQITLILTFLLSVIMSILVATFSLDVFKTPTFVISTITFLLGYVFATYFVLKVPPSLPLPQIIREKKDEGKGHTAILYFSHGEPEYYTPVAWLHQFQEFDRQHIPFIPWPFRPFFLYSLRKHYSEVGSSHHKQGHGKIINKIEQSYRNSGDNTTRFYLSFLDDLPYPDTVAIQAMNEGASEIIVAEVFVTQSNHTHEGEQLVKQLNTHEYNIKLGFTTPLWDSALIYQMFVEKAVSLAEKTPLTNVAVLLVGHGQPDAWDREFPTETEQEIKFRENIRDALIKRGFLPEYVQLAWMEFKDPRVTNIAKEMSNKHIEKLIFFPTSISADAIHSQWDIPNMVKKANIPQNIAVVNGGAWNDYPLVIQAIREKIEAVRKIL